MNQNTTFNTWCANNYLKVELVADNIYVIMKGAELQTASYFLLLTDKDKIVDNKFVIQLSDAEKQILTTHKEISQVVYCWGGRYYVEKASDKIEANFNEFWYVGQPNTVYESSYTHLGIHTHYELMNGVQAIQPYINKAVFHKAKAIGICDHNTLAGVIEFQKLCNKAKLKPIIGMSIDVKVLVGEPPIRVKLYVSNKEGWKNLLKINKIINVDNEDKTIEYDSLCELAKGLILVIDKSKYNFTKLPHKDYSVASLLNEYFNYVFYQIDSVCYEDSDKQIEYLQGLQSNIEYFSDVNIQPILIEDTYYVEQESWKIKQDLYSIDRNKNIHTDADISKNQHYKTLDETYAEFRKYDSGSDELSNLLHTAIHNTEVLTDYCNFQVDLTENKLPVFTYIGNNPKYQNISNVDLFQVLLYEGFAIKLPKLTKQQKAEYLERMAREYKVIVRTKFVDYFLIIWDIMNYANSVGIRKGLGRGSVVGSLIAYLLDITDVDPIKYNLLFERFLNVPESLSDEDYAKVAYPDIDCDFGALRRDEIKQYINDRYGYNQVCSVGTYTSYKCKGGFKALLKLKGYSYETLNALCKNIVNEELEQTWKDLFISAIECKESNPALYNLINKEAVEVNKMKTLLGTYNTKSIHASAVLIVPQQNSKGELTTIHDYLPLIKNEDDRLVSQWCGDDTGAARFLKEDILGLKQLDKFDEIFSHIKETTGEVFILRDIPTNDSRVFELFSKGLTEDVFQFNEEGIKEYCRIVKPDSLEDLIAMNALYRPGTMRSGTHTTFADIKHGRKKVVYDYGLESVTKNTYGLYIYQEQIMQSVVVLGGFTLVEADNVRQAIKKKDKEKLHILKLKFVAGAELKGCSAKEAENIWAKLDEFSNYGFNRSHSAAYSLMSYHSQWFKVNYPLQFWTTALNHSDDENLCWLIDELSTDNRIKFAPADINLSNSGFTCKLENKEGFIGTIISGFRVKGLGSIAAKGIIEVRNAGGAFVDLADFVRRTKNTKVNTTQVANLILAGCFDSLYNIEVGSESKRYNLYCDYMRGMKKDIDKVMQYPENSTSNIYFQLKQKELTGIGTIDYKSLLYAKQSNWASYCINASQYIEKLATNADKLVLVGELSDIELKRNKKNEIYVTFNINVNGRIISCFVWNRQYKENEIALNNLVKTAKKSINVIAVFGVKGERNFVVDSIKVLN